MTIKVELTETESKSSINETARIMDEMDRLLTEMKEMMFTIKRIMGEEIEWQAHVSSIENETACLLSKNIIRSS